MRIMMTMTRSVIDQFLDCLSGWLGIRIRFDGDLVTPESPDDPWWY